jgi:hypothetical protein
MNLLERIFKKKLVLTGKEYDYTGQGWGHTAGIKNLDHKTGKADGCIFAFRPINIGDVILVNMESGKIGRWAITEITSHPADPGDQYFVNYKFIGYKEN